MVKLISTYTKLLPLCFCLYALNTHAQNTWSLDSCYNYALSHNLEFNSKTLEYKESQLGISQAKLNALPSLNASATHGYNWGQRIDPFTNQFATNRVRSNDFSLNGRFDVFDGLQKFYDRKKSRLENLSKKLELDDFRVNLKIDIAKQFFDILMQQEVLRLAQSQLTFTQRKKQRILQFVEANKLARSEIVEIASVEAQDRLAVIEAQNNLNLSHLLLKQKLNLDREHKLNLEPYDDKDLMALSSKVLKAQNLPEFQLSENRVLYQQTELAQSKGALMPKIFITGSLGSGYSENNTFVLEDGTFRPKPLSNQLDENLYKSVIMTMSIPILNGFNRSLSVQRNKLALERARNNRQQMSNEVTNKLEQMDMDINGGYTKYEALQATLDFHRVSLDLASEKYDEGMIDLYGLEDARNKLLRAEIDLLKSKYELFLLLEKRDAFGEFNNSNP